MNKLLLYLVIISHHVLVLSLVTGTVICSIMQPWYLGLLAWVVLIRTATSKSPCILTNIENSVRLKLGRKRIGGFVGHYYKKPLRVFINAIKAL